MLVYILRSLKQTEKGEELLHYLLTRLKRWVNTILLPSALIVLISGVAMIVQFNRETLPFYLLFMEQFGYQSDGYI
ncbi:hypothetical protein GCM10010965_02230 [Caldalkalibacillus thermarum]|nr:hypothetical protein GCM10010965_02230 [Caldalkalibacillus thermarum]